MIVTVNGETRRLKAGTTVGDLVDEVSRDGRRGVAAALNGQVVPRNDMDLTTLCPDDRLELVGAVQGGGT